MIFFIFIYIRGCFMSSSPSFVPYIYGANACYEADDYPGIMVAFRYMMKDVSPSPSLHLSVGDRKLSLSYKSSTRCTDSYVVTNKPPFSDNDVIKFSLRTHSTADPFTHFEIRAVNINSDQLVELQDINGYLTIFVRFSSQPFDNQSPKPSPRPCRGSHLPSVDVEDCAVVFVRFSYSVLKLKVSKEIERRSSIFEFMFNIQQDHIQLDEYQHPHIVEGTGWTFKCPPNYADDADYPSTTVIYDHRWKSFKIYVIANYLGSYSSDQHVFTHHEDGVMNYVKNGSIEISNLVFMASDRVGPSWARSMRYNWIATLYDKTRETRCELFVHPCHLTEYLLQDVVVASHGVMVHKPYPRISFYPKKIFPSRHFEMCRKQELNP